MNAFERTIEELDAMSLDFVAKGLKPLEKLSQNNARNFAKLAAMIEDYRKTGTLPDLDLNDFELGTECQSATPNPKTTEKNPTRNNRNSLKENIEPDEAPKGASPPRTRPRRNAFKEATQTINEQTSLSLNAKLRRPANLQQPFQNVYVKMEKLSINSMEMGGTVSDVTEVAGVKVKTEMEEMPAPSKPAPKNKKRKNTKAQVKQEKIEEDLKVRDSDVVVQDTTVTLVNLVSDDELENTVVREEEKAAKSRTKGKKTKRSRVGSPEEDSRKKRSKSSEEEEKKESADATFVAKPSDNVNATIVVENPKFQNLPQSVNDLMTDDESEEEVKKSPQKPRNIPKPTKQIFSPFEQSPVKKKVEAFEKLNEATALPTRVTRTKTKARAKQQEESDEEPKSIVKEKAKMFTPLASNKFLPSASSTSLRPPRNVNSSSNESLISTKSASALKASQAEYREREKRRREKEQEALKKREALIQAQIEEKKRKREEKQLKAQQQREALEKEKLKALEVQKLKDERHKQLLAEQEEKKQRMKEEQEKKRKMAKLRAIEEKKKEEEKRLYEQKKQEELAAKLAKKEVEIGQMLQKQKEKQVPIYMRTRTPLLPTEDCYDSDDERANERIKLPEWNKESDLKCAQKFASIAGEALKNSFFSIQAQTPDLQDIFEVIEPQKLKRTSSAVWHKQPRFTMMPVLDKHDETEEFADCYDE